MNKRIWELDAARGLALIGMILIHFVFDLTELTGILTWQEPGWFLFLKNHGGALFLVISGISATLAKVPPWKQGVVALGPITASRCPACAARGSSRWRLCSRTKPAAAASSRV